MGWLDIKGKRVVMGHCGKGYTRGIVHSGVIKWP